MSRCPKCNEEIDSVILKNNKTRKIERPIKNPDGSINWFNLFYVDIGTLLLIVGVILLLFGMRQINSQCYQILEKPCQVIDKYECTGEYKYPSSGLLRNFTAETFGEELQVP